MYPAWWDKTVTLYHRVVASGLVTWQRTTHSGAFVQRKAGSVNVDTSRRDGNRIVCRLRAPAPVVVPGDIICIAATPGDIDETERGQTSADFLMAHADEAFVISEVHDNTTARIPLKHVYIGGA